MLAMKCAAPFTSVFPVPALPAMSAWTTSAVIVVLDCVVGCEPKPPSASGPPPPPSLWAGACSQATAPLTAGEPLWWAATRASTAQAVVSVAAAGSPSVGE